MDRLTDFLGSPKMSIVKALLIFYLLVASSFTRNLASGRLQDLMENRFAQHVVGYITMLVIMITFGGVTGVNAALYSLVGYLWFICTTKLSLEWNLVVLGLIIAVYMYESRMTEQENFSHEDQALEDEDIERISERNRKIKLLLVAALVGVTLVGVYYYAEEKQLKFGNNFNGEMFLLKGRERAPDNTTWKLTK